MELKDFIKIAVNEVMDAIEEVNLERGASGKKGQLNPKIVNSEEFELDTIEFDVAVTIGDKKSGNAEGGINVLGAKLGAGGKVEKEASNASRVKFSLGVAWPYIQLTDVKKLNKSNKNT